MFKLVWFLLLFLLLVFYVKLRRILELPIDSLLPDVSQLQIRDVLISNKSLQFITIYDFLLNIFFLNDTVEPFKTDTPQNNQNFRLLDVIFNKNFHVGRKLVSIQRHWEMSVLWVVRLKRFYFTLNQSNQYLK